MLAIVLRRTLLHHVSRDFLDVVTTHHGFHLVETHHLPRGNRRELLKLRLGLRVRLPCSGSRLLGLQTPNVGARLELRNILGVVVTLITSSRGLGSVRNRGFLLGRRLASLEEHLLLVDGTGDLGGLAGKIEIFANAMLGCRAAKSVIIEGIVGLIEAVA